MLLIVAATEFEIKEIKKKYGESNEIDILVTGVGIINTLFEVQNYIFRKKCETDDILILNTGIAGGFENTELNEICLCKTEILSEFGICFKDKIKYFKEYPAVKISNKLSKFIEKNFVFDKTGTSITVNCVTAFEERKNFLQKKFNPVVENMEGYAVAYLGNKLSLNYAEIRGISNFVGDRDNWRKEESIEKLNRFVIEIIEELKKNDFKI